MLPPPCLNIAAQHWGLHKSALVRQYDAHAQNRNTQEDKIGIMGISSEWLPVLEKNGYTLQQLKNNTCANIQAAALVMAVKNAMQTKATKQVHPAPVCLRQSALQYGISYKVANAYYQRMQNVSVSTNNASHSVYGPMHVPAGWLPLLRYAGFPEWRVKHDACWNVAAGVWILAAEHAGGMHQGGSWKSNPPINGIPAIPAQIIQDAAYASAQTGVPKNLLMAVAWQESGFDPNAVSYAGAQGLMQFIPSTWGRYGQGSPFNPRQAMLAGARYLRHLDLKFHSWPLALAGYNAGGQAVVNAGYRIPDFTQTQHYVPAVLGRYQVLANQSGTR